MNAKTRFGFALNHPRFRSDRSFVTLRLKAKSTRLSAWLLLGIWFLLITLCVAWATPAPLKAGNDQPLTESSSAIAKEARLRFPDGTSLPGQAVLDASYRNGIGIQPGSVASPWFFDIGGIRSLELPQNSFDAGESERIFRTLNGEQMAGELVAFQNGKFQILNQSLGLVSILPDQLSEIVDVGDLGSYLFRGPGNESNWDYPVAGRVWWLEYGSLITAQKSAKAIVNAGLPDKCQIELDFSWNRNPSFTVLFATGLTEEQKANAFRVETWDDKLAMVREIGKRSDASIVSKIDRAQTELTLIVYIDQSMGRMTVSTNQSDFQTITVQNAGQQILPYLQVENYGKELRLNRLDVVEWDGTLPERLTTQEDRSASTPSSYDRIIGYDSQTDSIVVEYLGERMDYSVTEFKFKRPMSAEDQSNSQSSIIELRNDRNAPQGNLQPKSNVTDQGNIDDDSFKENDLQEVVRLKLKLHDRTELVGEWLEVADQRIWLQTNWSPDPIGVTLGSIASLAVIGSTPEIQRPASTATEGTSESAIGTLQTDEFSIRGWLASSPSVKNGDSPYPVLSWHPKNAINEAGLLPNTTATIDYRATSEESPLSRYRVPMGLQLTTGDYIQTTNEKIDKDGVHFISQSTAKTFVKHAYVKTLGMRSSGRSNVDEEKMEKLLTIPRSQTLEPPTHIIASITGDYLRCRLLAMDSETATIQVRMTQVTLPRYRIAAIVWLHPAREFGTNADDSSTFSDEQPHNIEGQEERQTNSSEYLPLVHVSGRRSGRATFRVRGVDAGVISGTSYVLGDFSQRIDRIDRIYIGPDAAERAEKEREHPWQIEMAPLPNASLTAPMSDSGADE